MNDDRVMGESSVALLKATALTIDTHIHTTFKVLEENGKWVREKLKELAKKITEIEGTETRDGGKVFSIPRLKIKLNTEGEVEYINYEGDYVISSYEDKGGTIQRSFALRRLLSYTSGVLQEMKEADAMKGEYEKTMERLESIKEQYVKERERLENLIRNFAKGMVSAFGYCKSSCYYISTVLDEESGKKKTLEIKVDRSSLSYIKLGDNYILSEYSSSDIGTYIKLLNILRNEMDKEIKFAEQKFKEMENYKIPEGLNEKMLQYREIIESRIGEMAMKIAVWYGERDGDNYNYLGKINYNGEQKKLKIKVEKGDLKYVVIGERYIISSYSSKPYLSWLLNTHKALYEFIMQRQRKIDVSMEEAHANARIPVEVEVKREVNPEVLGDFDIEEARIVLPKKEKKGDVIFRKVVSWKDGEKLIWDNYRMKEVNVRKPHVCERCGREIEKGERALVITERTKRGRHITHYYCSDEYEIGEEEIVISAGAKKNNGKKKEMEIGM